MSATSKVGQFTVGTTAVQLDTSSVLERRTVILQAAQANTGRVYIGFDNTVTISGATGGIELSSVPLDLPIDPSDQIWAIASAASQVVSMVQTALGPG